jgi:hypothetical protein
MKPKYRVIRERLAAIHAAGCSPLTEGKELAFNSRDTVDGLTYKERTSADWAKLPHVKCPCGQTFSQEHPDQTECRDCLSTHDTLGEESHVELFQGVLAKVYSDLFVSDPEYAYSASKTTPDVLAAKMTAGLKTGGANHNGTGIRRACKAVGIKPTLTAIMAFLNEASAGFKTIQDNVPMRTRLRRINNYLSKLGVTYHSAIPLDDMFTYLRSQGFEAVQEDRTPWVGLLTGRDGDANIELMDMTIDKPAKVWFHVAWHKMDVTGNYEVTAYVN